MKVIIAGSRDIFFPHIVGEAVEESGFDVTEVVSGGAVGVDALGELYAKQHGLPIHVILAEWSRWGKAAGTIRNRAMADYVAPAGGLVAVWNGKSTGTAHMIETANRARLKFYVRRI